MTRRRPLLAAAVITGCLVAAGTLDASAQSPTRHYDLGAASGQFDCDSISVRNDFYQHDLLVDVAAGPTQAPVIRRTMLAPRQGVRGLMTGDVKRVGIYLNGYMAYQFDDCAVAA